MRNTLVSLAVQVLTSSFLTAKSTKNWKPPFVLINRFWFSIFRCSFWFRCIWNRTKKRWIKIYLSRSGTLNRVHKKRSIWYTIRAGLLKWLTCYFCYRSLISTIVFWQYFFRNMLLQIIVRRVYVYSLCDLVF